METTPRANRLQIGIFGRRNVGKSSLINALTGQDVALVSEKPGTTTDPVSKAMEIPGLGPVVLVDTAGLDDEGPLGELRVQRTEKVLSRIHLAIVVTDPATLIGPFERKIIAQLKKRKLPTLLVVNKQDLASSPLPFLDGIQVLGACAKTGAGIKEIIDCLVKIAPSQIEPPAIAGDLISKGEHVLLVMPQGKAAPKGRLILPQVQTIRDLLDHRGIVTSVQPEELEDALKLFKKPPALVIVDSQVFSKAAQVLPPTVPLTSFSILFARFKGDLPQLVAGIEAVKSLKPGDKVLIAEGCTHHSLDDDIGRVKIPRLLEEKAGGKLVFRWSSGSGFPQDLDAKLVVFCGSCMLGRTEVLSRLNQAKESGLAAVNYGVLLAYFSGILERAIEPFGLKV